MKLITPLLFIIGSLAAASASEDLAPDVLLPRISGPWETATAPTGKPQPVEVTPGHFYLTAPAKAAGYTSVYHTTKPADFKLDDPKVNVKAMHLVADLPVAGGVISQKEGKWFITGKPGKDAEAQAAPLTWEEPTVITPRPKDGKVIRVALFDDYGSFGKGVPRCTELLSKVESVKVTPVKPDLIRAGGLKDFDVVIFTGGSGGKQAGTLGLLGREQVRRFVEAGGGYLGICAGNYLACDGFSWGVKVLDAKTKSSKWARGEGQLKIEFTEKGREILGMPEGIQEIRYANGPVFDPAGDPAIGDFEPLAFFRSEFAKNGAPEGAQVNSPAMVMGNYGQGRVLCSSPHPEQQAGMEHFVERAVRWLAGGGAQ